jgi:hypothetical protein
LFLKRHKRCAFGSLAVNPINTPTPSHSVWLLRAPGERPTNRRPAEKANELPPPRDRLPQPAEQAKSGGEDTTSSHGGLGSKAMTAPCVRSSSNCGHWPTWLAGLFRAITRLMHRIKTTLSFDHIAQALAAIQAGVANAPPSGSRYRRTGGNSKCARITQRRSQDRTRPSGTIASAGLGRAQEICRCTPGKVANSGRTLKSAAS